jgi:hypothetical protein
MGLGSLLYKREYAGLSAARVRKGGRRTALTAKLQDGQQQYALEHQHQGGCSVHQRVLPLPYDFEVAPVETVRQGLKLPVSLLLSGTEAR